MEIDSRTAPKTKVLKLTPSTLKLSECVVVPVLEGYQVCNILTVALLSAAVALTAGEIVTLLDTLLSVTALYSARP